MPEYLKCFLKEFYNFVFPKCCYFCEDILDCEKYICANCFRNIKQTLYHITPKNNELFYMLYKDVEIEGAFSLFYFEKGGVLQNLIHLLKYRGKKNIAIWLGEIYGNILKNEYNCNFDYIIPVPLYLGSQKKRGYNQSEMISIGLNKYLNVQINCNSLIRVKRTQAQTHLNLIERKKNVKSVFLFNNNCMFINKNILLVDDIITTGSTILECVKTIKKDINCRITICSLGRAFD